MEYIGKQFSPKKGVKIKIIEKANGFINVERGYWVRVISGFYAGFEKNDEFLMSQTRIKKHLKKEQL